MALLSYSALKVQITKPIPSWQRICFLREINKNKMRTNSDAHSVIGKCEMNTVRKRTLISTEKS